MMRVPITDPDVLAGMDQGEFVAGYWEGFAGEPEPGDNRPYEFWHGWVAGASDKKHIEAPDWLRVCADKVAARSRLRAIMSASASPAIASGPDRGDGK